MHPPRSSGYPDAISPVVEWRQVACTRTRARVGARKTVNFVNFRAETGDLGQRRHRTSPRVRARALGSELSKLPRRNLAAFGSLLHLKEDAHGR
jgi:hypothetical protein